MPVVPMMPMVSTVPMEAKNLPFCLGDSVPMMPMVLNTVWCLHAYVPVLCMLLICLCYVCCLCTYAAYVL